MIKQLQRVQNAAARVVTLSPKFYHITSVLANLHWLSIYFQIELKILIVTCKPLHGLAPAYIKMFFWVTSRNGILGLQRKIYLSCLLLTWTVMAGELFLLLRRFFGTVFLSILGMLDHWTFLKDSWKLFFLDAPFETDYMTMVFLYQVLNYFIFSFCSFLFLNFKFKLWL